MYLRRLALEAVIKGFALMPVKAIKASAKNVQEAHTHNV
jgi:hypothetical protein